MTKLSELPVPERAARYREMAAGAERIGRAADDELSQYYLSIAAQWRQMAEALEPVSTARVDEDARSAET